MRKGCERSSRLVKKTDMRSLKRPLMLHAIPIQFMQNTMYMRCKDRVDLRISQWPAGYSIVYATFQWRWILAWGGKPLWFRFLPMAPSYLGRGRNILSTQWSSLGYRISGKLAEGISTSLSMIAESQCRAIHPVGFVLETWWSKGSIFSCGPFSTKTKLHASSKTWATAIAWTILVGNCNSVLIVVPRTVSLTSRWYEGTLRYGRGLQRNVESNFILLNECGSFILPHRIHLSFGVKTIWRRWWHLPLTTTSFRRGLWLVYCAGFWLRCRSLCWHSSLGSMLSARKIQCPLDPYSW